LRSDAQGKVRYILEGDKPNQQQHRQAGGASTHNAGADTKFAGGAVMQFRFGVFNLLVAGGMLKCMGERIVMVASVVRGRGVVCRMIKRIVRCGPHGQMGDLLDYRRAYSFAKAADKRTFVDAVGALFAYVPYLAGWRNGGQGRVLGGGLVLGKWFDLAGFGLPGLFNDVAHEGAGTLRLVGVNGRLGAGGAGLADKAIHVLAGAGWLGYPFGSVRCVRGSYRFAGGHVVVFAI
jgi:hypothetical protein